VKAILEFDLPDDQEEFELASQAHRYSGSLYQIDSWMRNQVEYGLDKHMVAALVYDLEDLPQEERGEALISSTIARVREQLAQIMQERNIEF
jgi:hypothetical protein